MSIDYNVYVGTYLEIKKNIQYRDEIITTRCCVNESCSKKCYDPTKFCNLCGSPIGEVTRTKSVEISFYDVMEKLELDNEIYGVNVASPKDTIIYVSNSGHGQSWDAKHDDGCEDFSDLDVKKEITDLEQELSPVFDKIEAEYGSRPVVKWGVLLYKN